MTSTAPTALDPRVAEALRDYEQALNGGTAVDRAAFLAQHADIADALAPLLDGAEALHGGARALAHDVPGGSANGHVALGEFRIVRELGRGGMGVVYEAEQASLGRRVAVKILPSGATDPVARRRFRTEARAAARLRHDHIVPVFAVGEANGVPYYAMQLVDGPSLAQVLRERRKDNAGPVDARTAAAWALRAAEALAHAHDEGVIHRDVKPGNLLLEGGVKVLVADFGLARVAGDAACTATGDEVGTPRYASPEQIEGRGVDGRGDVYSLGATLYELLTLRPPFYSDDKTELRHMVLTAEPKPPRALCPAIPVDLETVVLKALQKEPADRYPSAAALADDLGRFLAGEDVRARRPSAARRLGRWAWRRRASLAAALATLVVSLAVGLVGLADAYRRAEAARVKAEKSNALNRRIVAEVWLPMMRHYSDSTQKLGAFPVELLARAEAAFDEIAEEDGFDAETRSATVRFYVHLAVVHQHHGKPEAARAAREKALAASRRLVADYPQEVNLQLQLSGVLNDIAGSFATLEEEEAVQRRSLEMAEEVAAQVPPQAALFDIRAQRHRSLGEVKFKQIDFAEGEVLFRRAVELADEALALSPEKGIYWRGRALNLDALANALRHQGRVREAWEVARQAVETGEKAVALAPKEAAYAIEEASYACQLSRLSFLLGRHAEATAAADRAAAKARAAHARFPQFPNGESWPWSALTLKAMACEALGRDADMRQSLDELIRLLLERAQEHKGEAECRIRLAWVYACRPGAAAADHAEAVRWAKEAVALAKEDWHAADTLAVAYHLAGRYEDADKERARCQTLPNRVVNSPQQMASWMFLRANALARQGEAEAARREYRRGADQLRAEPDPAWTHRRLLAETRRIVGAVD